MKKILLILCMSALMSVLCVACGGGGDKPETLTEKPTPPEPEKPKEPEEPQEISFYYLGDERTEFKVCKDKVIIKAETEEDAKALCELDVFSADNGEVARIWYDVLILASIDPEKTTIDDVRKLPGVSSATYGLEDDDEFMYWPMDRIFVQLLEGVSLESILDEAGFTEYVEDTDSFTSYYMITLNMNLEHIMWASNELHETGLCEYTEPALIMQGILH